MSRGRTAPHFTFACDGELLSCAALDPAVEARPGVEANPGAEDGDRPAAVLLHGAGTSDEGRFSGLLGDLAARGHQALCFDFSGHGASSGRLPHLSLRRRFTQARAVIDAHVPPGRRLLLIGFSMSGQTVADLVAHYGSRVAAIGLCAPAVYDRAAWDVPFGDGSLGCHGGMLPNAGRAVERMAAAPPLSGCPPTLGVPRPPGRGGPWAGRRPGA
ncbi:alpha/beta hydrolase [Streptomyces sp. P1-3]|uniref:alpha/beta hydrolase n=1 Tax=Streptomyces sp. P1-3 TaxID=3421658 RepID=UPI003D35B4F8